LEREFEEKRRISPVWFDERWGRENKWPFFPIFYWYR